jgi:hypothetical protein
LSGAPSATVLATTSDTDGVVGIVINSPASSGTSQVAVGGQASCVFDGATTAGHFVTISAITSGDCADAGASRPTGSQTIGRVLASGAAGTYAVDMAMSGANGA